MSYDGILVIVNKYVMNGTRNVKRKHSRIVPNCLPRICGRKWLCSVLMLFLYFVVFPATNNGRIVLVHAQLGTRGNGMCRIDDEPIQTLAYDASQGLYVRVDRNTTVGNPNTRHRGRLRGLRHGDHDQHNPDSLEDSAAIVAQTPSAKSVSRSALMELPIFQNSEPIEMRICDCADRFQMQSYDFYCPLNKYFCSVSRTSFPMCIDAPTARTYLAVNLKLFAVTSLTLLVVWLCVSPRGHDALACCASHLCPCYFKDWYLNFLIQKKPARVNKMIRGWVEERRDRLEARYRELQRLHGDVVSDDAGDVNTEPLTPLDPFEESLVREIYESRPALVLKTRYYKSLPPKDSVTDTTASSFVPMMSSSDTVFLQDSNTVETDTHDNVSSYGLLDDKRSDGRRNTYDHDDSSRNDDEKHETCMICFVTVADGDRIGILPNCNHIFHASCLKDWLKRRNVCPLCLDANVAVSSSSSRLKPS